jgi:CBS domain-containing protein
VSVRVADVMSERVIAVGQDARFGEIVAAIRRFRIASVPVIDAEGRVIGLVSEDDLLGREVGRSLGRGLLARLRGLRDRSQRTEPTAAELMSSPAETVVAATPVREAARMMYRRNIRRLPVVEPVSDRLVGMVTRSDLLAVYERPDEDVRREILYDIIRDTLGMDPERFTVSVVSGTVMIRGEVESRSAAGRLAEAIGHVEGVATVDDRLVYRQDSRTSKAPPAHL